ncbi:MAG: hypothetical protein ACOCRK_02715 [bacterium]
MTKNNHQIMYCLISILKTSYLPDDKKVQTTNTLKRLLEKPCLNKKDITFVYNLGKNHKGFIKNIINSRNCSDKDILSKSAIMNDLCFYYIQANLKNIELKLINEKKVINNIKQLKLINNDIKHLNEESTNKFFVKKQYKKYKKYTEKYFAPLINL